MIRWLQRPLPPAGLAFGAEVEAGAACASGGGAPLLFVILFHIVGVDEVDLVVVASCEVAVWVVESTLQRQAVSFW